MKISRIRYQELNSKQQEIYNFQKVAGVLADYGFNCIKLADDWHGADFLAYHKDGNDTLKVQLKSRMSIGESYRNKSLYITFPLLDAWCLIAHDELIELIGQKTSWLSSSSWLQNGKYHSQNPSQALTSALKPFLYGRRAGFADLFNPKPTDWQLRGDPQLWDALESYLSVFPAPSNEAELLRAIYFAFERVTGFPITTLDDFELKSLHRGGLSGGWVSMKFWGEDFGDMLMVNRPAFRRHPGAIIHGNDRGVYEQQAVHG